MMYVYLACVSYFFTQFLIVLRFRSLEARATKLEKDLEQK